MNKKDLKEKTQGELYIEEDINMTDEEFKTFIEIEKYSNEGVYYDEDGHYIDDPESEDTNQGEESIN